MDRGPWKAAEIGNEGGTMKKINPKVALTILVIFAVEIVLLISLKTYAATPKKSDLQVWNPGCVAAVPKSWGAFKGGSAQSGLAFEDGAGNLRFLTNIPCGGTPAVTLEIRRTVENPSN
jgi:hypothetical protein